MVNLDLVYEMAEPAEPECKTSGRKRLDLDNNGAHHINQDPDWHHHHHGSHRFLRQGPVDLDEYMLPARHTRMAHIIDGRRGEPKIHNIAQYF
jgi:hypothetical protein